MIEVKELTKIYKSRRGGKCVALDRISFTLPDKGFVFVVGKSGSGKTTLLSLLGGLDTITSGEIIENGRRFGDLSLGDQVYYRNSTIGFIFQDFHLIETMTILENVMLALEFQGSDDEGRALRALRETGLEAFRDRYPKELSGGQKQRVAIARALVKDPAILLADEPTGNLDSKTTVQVLSLLKRLSKDKLVVIVSHNLTDAQNYADEILELSDGHILQHMRRNAAFDPCLRVEGDTLVIPSGQEFTEENVYAVNGFLARWYVRRVRQDKDRFRPCEKRRSGGDMSKVQPLERKHLRFSDTVKTAVKFTRRSRLRILAYSVILAALMVVLGLSQLIMNFNGGEVIASEMAKRGLSCDSFIKDTNSRYESVDTTRLVDVEEGDLAKFAGGGYQGKIYPLVYYPLFNIGNDYTVLQQRFSLRADPYSIPGTVGVLVTEESYVEKIFGGLEYEALAEEPKDYGVYITDYFADAYRIGHPERKLTYRDMLGEFIMITDYRHAYINGIIKTGYKERYRETIERLSDPTMSKDALKELAKSDECLAFFNELCQYWNVAYSFEPDFVERVAASDSRNIVPAGLTTFEAGGKTFSFTDKYFCTADFRKPSVSLADNEAVFGYDTYNNVFGTNYTPRNLGDFVPHEVKLTYYYRCDRDLSAKKYETTLTIVGLTSQPVVCNVADNVFKELQRAVWSPYGYYFDGGQEELLFNIAEANGFIPNSSIAGSITTMTKAVGVFGRFFNLIFLVLCAALLLLMVLFEVKGIKDKMKDIGILKALGARERDLVFLFGFQAVAAGLLMTVFYILGSFVFIGLANKVLVLSLNELVKNTMVMDLSFLAVKWSYLLRNCLLAIGILAVSFLVPMLRLRTIKPTNVIKAKE